MKKYIFMRITLNCVDFLGNDLDLYHYLYNGSEKIDFQTRSKL